MEDVTTIVADFLRDASYRIAELGAEIDEARREGTDHEDQLMLRAELILWMDLLLESRSSIYGDDFNYLDDFTDFEIINECEHLRDKSGMNDIPYLTFAGYSPEIRTIVSGEPGGSGLPAGIEGDHIIYNNSNLPVTQPFPKTGGQTTETIDQYFG